MVSGDVQTTNQLAIFTGRLWPFSAFQNLGNSVHRMTPDDRSRRSQFPLVGLRPLAAEFVLEDLVDLSGIRLALCLLHDLADKETD